MQTLPVNKIIAVYGCGNYNINIWKKSLVHFLELVNLGQNGEVKTCGDIEHSSNLFSP